MYDSDKPDSDIMVMGNNVEQYTMGVQISSKVFSMNIDGIYQDKFGSTVRELSANALDIHKQCGIIDKPFDIHVPSELTGKFIIRDYGCGLSKENILKFFGQLFCSSKDQENDSVGFFGIGCKSPFTVTDDFLVVSIHDGIRTEYAFSRENKGTPRCIVLSSKPTDEPSGIEITIDSGETEEWLTAIRNQLLMFPTKPNVYMDGEIIDVGYYELKKYGDVYYGKGLPKNIYINQGGVIYPIDQSQFPSIGFKCAYSNSAFVIYTCDIGMITVPPDRERIEITPENIESLHTIVEKSNLNIDSDMMDFFFESYENTYSSMKNIFENHQHLVDMRSIVKNQITNPIFTPVVQSIIGARSFYQSLYYNMHNWDGSKWLKASPSYYSAFNGKYNRSKKSSHNLVDVFTRDMPIILLPHNTNISTAYELFRRSYTGVYILRCRKNKIDEVEKFMQDYKAFFESNSEIIALTPVKAKETQDKIKNTRKTNPIAAKQFYKMNLDDIASTYMTFIEVDKDDLPKDTDEFYLMEVDNSVVSLTHTSYRAHDVDVKQIILSGCLDKPIYFMRSKDYKYFKYGTKIESHQKMIQIFMNSDSYYDVIYSARKNKMGWGWSNAFKTTHIEYIKSRFKKRSNVEINTICNTLNINLSDRKHSLNDVVVKIDAFSKVKNVDMKITKNLDISSKDVRNLIKNYFVE